MTSPQKPRTDNDAYIGRLPRSALVTILIAAPAQYRPRNPDALPHADLVDAVRAALSHALRT